LVFFDFLSQGNIGVLKMNLNLLQSKICHEQVSHEVEVYSFGPEKGRESFFLV
jgi:hypothetical protein